MAISFISSGIATNSNTPSLNIGTLTNGCLVCYVVITDKTSSASATYNSVPMTLATSIANVGSEGVKLFIFVLENPSNGSNTLSVSPSIGSVSRVAWASYSGVKQSAQPEAENKSSLASSNTMTQAVTVINNNAWVVAMMYFGTGGSFSSGSNYTNRTTTFQCSIGDSNGGVSSGSYSQTITVSTTSTGGTMMGQVVLTGAASSNSNLLLLGIG